MGLSGGLKRKLHRLRVVTVNGSVNCSPELWAKLSQLVAQKIENWSETAEEWTISLPCAKEVVVYINAVFEAIAWTSIIEKVYNTDTDEEDDEEEDEADDNMLLDSTKIGCCLKTVDYLQTRSYVVRTIVDRISPVFWKLTSAEKVSIVETLAGTDILNKLTSPRSIANAEGLTDLTGEKAWVDLLPDRERSPDGAASRLVRQWMKPTVTFQEFEKACSLLGMTDRARILLVLEQDPVLSRPQSFVWGLYDKLATTEEDVKDLWKRFHMFEQRTDPLELDTSVEGSTSHWYFLWGPESSSDRVSAGGIAVTVKHYTEEKTKTWIVFTGDKVKVPLQWSCIKSKYATLIRYKKPVNFESAGTSVLLKLKRSAFDSIKVPTVLRLTVHW